jgi:chemotaxis signal transduction protein
MNETEIDKRARILDERARKLAARVPRAARPIALDGVVVSIGGETFVVAAGSVREIRATPAVTRLPDTAPWIRGICYVRGEILTVVDIARWFETAVPLEGRFLAVLRGDRGRIAIGVDEVLGFRTVHEDELVPPSSSARPVRAITRDLVSWLDVGLLLERREILVG